MNRASLPTEKVCFPKGTAESFPVVREQTWLAALVPLRLYAGYALLRAGIMKLRGHWLGSAHLANQLSGWLKAGKTYAFYAPFLRDHLLPHAGTLTVLVVTGEVLSGAALLLGLFSRWAAAGALFLTLNIMLAAGDPIAATSSTAFVFITLTLLLTAPGRVLGLDAALRNNLPRWLV